MSTTELISKVLDHGLAGAVGLVAIGINLWIARVIFANLRGQNDSQRLIERDLATLLERAGRRPARESAPPGPPPPQRRIIPRAPTPLPFCPVEASKEEGGEP